MGKKGNHAAHRTGPEPGRRTFLKTGILAVSGAGLTSISFSRPGPDPEPATEPPKIVWRTLGRTGIKLPIVSMGTGSTTSPRLVGYALDKGVKFLATASLYQEGKNERMVGDVISGRDRKSVFIQTGTGNLDWIDTQTGEFNDKFDPKQYLQLVDDSLKRLKVDYVDILMQGFTGTRKSVFFKPFRDAMEMVRKAGKAKFIGIATHRMEHEAVRAAADSGDIDVVMTAYNFRRKGWRYEQDAKKLDEAIQYAAESGLGVIAMKTMAGAFWDKERTMPINSKAALKWVLQNKYIHTAVPDCTSFDQMDQNFGLMGDLKLTEEEEQALTPPSKELVSGLYCLQCGRCVSQCPEGMDIPTMMRSYMYAYGYGNLNLARKTLSSSGLRGTPCSGCSKCTVNCTVGFDVRSKILDISRLRDIPEDFTRLT